MTQSMFHSRSIVLFILLLTLWQLSSFSARVQAQQDGDPGIEPVTIMVTGRRPGPPLWKVSKGEHALYIFGYLSPLPKRMRWDDSRVKEVLNRAQEFISMPNFGWNPSLPVTLMGNPEGKMLEEVLPDEYWALYLAFTEEHFRRFRQIEELRPAFAASSVTMSLFNRHDLVTADKVLKSIDKLAKRNRGMKWSNPNLAMPESLEARINAGFVSLVENMAMAQELACFELSLKRVMPDITLMKQAANAWAEADLRELGYLHDLRRSASVQGATGEPCSFSALDDAALQVETKHFQDARIANWLTVVEAALANNTTTFAMLGMDMLLNEALLLDKLRERGYEVQVPNQAVGN